MFTARDPAINRLKQEQKIGRPNSTMLMQEGAKDTKKLIKKKFDLPNARARDPT